MSSALDDIIGEVTPEHVERRVADWIQRLNDLYALLESWLPPGWKARRGRTTSMHEELMQSHGVSARTIPILELNHSTSHATVEPRALWVIGANGRVDLRTDKGVYLIVDTSGNFEPTNWQAAPTSDRRKLQPLTKQSFQSVL